MVRIDLALVKKRTEHHDGPLSTLEEIALHQFKIRKIEFLNDECKNLRILLLYNNKIQRIENLNRMKSLCYLNLALNRITRVENLERLESLRKLDLTANFVTDYRTLSNLATLPFFGELYMTGNPCCSEPHYRIFVVTTLPVLQKLDGTDVTKTERITALYKYQEVIGDIEQAHYTTVLPDYVLNSDNSDYEENDAGTRLTRAAEQTAIDRVGEKEKAKHEKGQMNDERVICQWNETGFPVSMDEDWKHQELCVRVHLPIHLSTNLVSVDVNETWFFLYVKEKSLQMRLDRRVKFGAVRANRITSTGVLKLHCPVCDDDQIKAPVSKGEEKQATLVCENPNFEGNLTRGIAITERHDDLDQILDVPDDLPDLI